MNFQPGPLAQTGVPTDLTIDGDGFFVVRTPNGERLTRNSEFTIAFDEDETEGTVTNQSGYPLLGERGEIKIPANQDFEVDPTGNVVAGDR